MRLNPRIATFSALLFVAQFANAANTGSPFYGDPPDDSHPWAVHDRNRPQPPVVQPKISADPVKPPADAVILFDGTEASLAKWEADKPTGEATKWVVKDGAMECVPKSGYIRTKEKFGDCKLHVEWAAPAKVEGESQGRGNSGIFLPGGVEVQVLDNYNNPTYADGFACSVYGVQPPLANALRPPGEWQIIDIEFRRPVYKDNQLVEPGYVTVYCNGVLVQDRTQLEGGTGHMRRTKPGPLPETGPLRFQDHGNPVRFRNVWYQPLSPRTEKVATTGGPMSKEATLAKRAEIAATLRADAAKLKDPANPLPEMLALAESLVYQKDDAALKQVEEMAGKWIDSIKALPADKLDSKKDEVKRVNAAFKYLTDKASVFPATFAPKVEAEKIIKSRGWDKK